MSTRDVGTRPFDGLTTSRVGERPGDSLVPLRFACPRCQAALEAPTSDVRYCPADESAYRRVDGIWRFLLPQREDYFQQFVAEYEAVRRAEGRGDPDPLYYQALPYRDLTGRFSGDWHIRARSYDALASQIVQPLARRRPRSLAMIDLGAGNGWLSNRLAQAGHAVAAVDLLTNEFDGLGAHVHYDVDFTPVQAEFDRLPFLSEQADLVVFNGSLHYAVDYGVTLAEARRVLSPDGQLVVMDSPVYRDAASGAQMVREREVYFEAEYGFPSNAIPSENYLTFARLKELGSALDLSWKLIRPSYGWRWRLRPWKTRLLGRREPAQFVLAVGTPDT
jgi:SAM-dependent methyltransferase